jgi:hypothetical protein
LATALRAAWLVDAPGCVVDPVELDGAVEDVVVLELDEVVGVVKVVTGMNSVGAGATVVDVDVVVFSSWNLA